MSTGSTRVVRNAVAQQFEIENAPGAVLQFAESAGRLRLIHTEVPPRLRGFGYGSQLARAAFEYARDGHLRVEPDCPFVRAYLARHPEFRPLVDAGHHHSPAEERRIRDAALDETLAASFPASDPLSTDPNPDEDD